MIERMERRIQVLEKQVPGFLGDLENMFGRRGTRFEFGRILLGAEPHIHFQIDSSRGPVDILLTEMALALWPDETLARWQLAHEYLHLIDPHKCPTNILEEGLAVCYQNKKVTRQFADREGPYAAAEELVRPFAHTLAAAIRRIRKDHRLAIGDIPEDVLLQYCPEVGARAQKLTARFRSRALPPQKGAPHF